MKRLMIVTGLILVMLLVPVSCAAPPAPESGALAIQPEITDITITGYHSTRDVEGNYDPDRVEATFNWETNKPCYYCFEVRPVDFDYPSNSGGYEKLDVSAPLPEGVKHSWPIVLKSGKLHRYILIVWDKEKSYITKSDTFWAPVVPKTTPPPAPAPSTMPPPPVPATEGVLIEMHTKTTMAGVARHLTISVDGSIVFIEEEGPRIVLPGSWRSRTTKTGQLTEAELSNLLAMVDACLFNSEGKYDARTEIIDTDAISELTVHYQKRTRIITANYQPLHPGIPELSDVPETVRKLYRELRYIIDSRTTQTAEEEITTAEVGQVLDIRVEPSPGTSLTKGIILDQAIVEVGSLDKPAFNPWNDRHYYVGDRCLLVLGDMRNDTDEDLYVDLWAEGFDSGERQVAWSISSGTMVGHVQLDMPQQSINSFEILLNWAEDVQLIKIIAHSYDRMIPSPPESK